MNFENIAGVFTKQSDGSLRGTIDASLSARAIRGSEDDKNYEFHTKLTLTTGKAGVIVNFDYDAAWLEYYLEMILDPTLNKVTLEAVIRNADGTENTRIVLASRDMTIATATEYDIRMVSKEIATDVYGVYGYVNGMLVVQIEDLADGFDYGMHGLECLGTDTQYSEFNETIFNAENSYEKVAEIEEFTGLISRSDLLGEDATLQTYHDFISNLIAGLSRFLDGECGRDEAYFINGGITITEIQNGRGSPYDADSEEHLESMRKKARRISPEHWPVLSITTFKELVGTTWHTRTEGIDEDYRLVNNVIYCRQYIPMKGFGNIEIVYKSGYATTPQGIKLALKELCKNFVQRIAATKNQAIVSFDRPSLMSFSDPKVYTETVKLMIKPFKQEWFGN